MRRDRALWVAYLTLAVSAFVMSSLSASLPFVRSDLFLTLSLAGHHSTAVALGILTAGFLGDRLLRHQGPVNAMKLASLGAGLGALGLVLAQNPGTSLPACYWMASFGSMGGIVVLSGLSSHPHRARALAEATVLASLAAAMAPVWLARGPGWRVSLCLGVLALVVGVRVLPGQPAPRAETAPRTGKLPPRFWLCWAALVCGIAVEQCTVLWGSTFMQEKLALARADAVSLISLFLLSMLTGRLVGSRIAQHRPEKFILRGSVALAGAGFTLYWLAPGTPGTLAGLVLTGLGVANFYPMTVALAMRTAPHLPGAVSARASLAAGTAFLVGPSLLAALGSRIGLANAHAQIPLLLIGLLISLECATRATGVPGLSVAHSGHGEKHPRLGPG